MELDESVPDYKGSTPEKFKSQISSYLGSYIKLKNALANDKFDESISENKELLASLEKIEMNLLDGEAHIYWMKKKSEIQKAKSHALAEAKVKVFKNFLGKL